MPARMWYHGIHRFLELLRYYRPSSQEHLLYFISLAYSLMTEFYETVHAFSDIWIECLGDLASYRMAIEDDECDRKHWLNIAMDWYNHLPNIVRLNILQPLFSRGAPRPFSSDRDPIVTVFNPIFNPDVFSSRSQPVGHSIVLVNQSASPTPPCSISSSTTLWVKFWVLPNIPADHSRQVRFGDDTGVSAVLISG